jgi:hypothetical protein
MAPEVRILSIRQPWVWAIVAGHKRVENRTWSTPYRGPVLLHASLRIDQEGAGWMQGGMGLKVPPELPVGGVVGLCNLVDVIEGEKGRRYGPWFCGPYGWVLKDPIALPRPIGLPGRLRLWKAPPEVVAEVNRQLPAARRLKVRVV